MPNTLIILYFINKNLYKYCTSHFSFVIICTINLIVSQLFKNASRLNQLHPIKVFIMLSAKDAGVRRSRLNLN